MLKILIAPDRLLMAWGPGFVLWHRMRSATMVSLTQGLALLGPLFGLVVLDLWSWSLLTSRGSRISAGRTCVR